MKYQTTVALGYDGFFIKRSQLSQNGKISDDILKKILSRKNNPHGNLLLCLKQYLEQHFNRIDIVMSFKEDSWNDTIGGLEGMVNRSEVDIGVPPLGMYEETLEMVDFAYPYKLDDSTFITHKPKYEPHFFWHISNVFAAVLGCSGVSFHCHDFSAPAHHEKEI